MKEEPAMNNNNVESTGFEAVVDENIRQALDKGWDAVSALQRIKDFIPGGADAFAQGNSFMYVVDQLAQRHCLPHPDDDARICVAITPDWDEELRRLGDE
jgi:hypothetical protein